MNVTCEKCLPLTEEFPANSSVYTTKLADNLLSYKAYELTIQTKNSVGLTEKISKVYIPELEKGKLYHINIHVFNCIISNDSIQQYFEIQSQRQ